MYITAYAPYGDGGILIRVETDIRRGIPGIDISGLAEGAVREARERVKAAFRNSGLAFPLDRILINLAPAGLKKEGAALDLPIALSVMAAAGLVPGLRALPEQLMVVGELELSGRVRPVRGVLAAAALGLAEDIRFFIVPKENEEEAAVLLGSAGAGKIHYCAVSSLDEAAHALVLLTQEGVFPPPFRASPMPVPPDTDVVFDCGDFADVRGQGRYKRALEIAAAGGHNLLVFGAPGAGKTMLARRLPSIMAPLTTEEAVEVTRIYSVAGRLESGGNTGKFSLVKRPPFRSPHHSASAEGILGGGKSIIPGEISLAHLGTLFLDEAPEFKTNVLQALREPLEDCFLTIVRASGPVRLPADFQLIMAANACPCGRLGASSAGTDPDKRESSCNQEHEHFFRNAGCLCSPEEIHRYWRKFGGALLDRIDLRVPIHAGNGGLYAGMEAGAGGFCRDESSADIRRRVLKAVQIQEQRFAKVSDGKLRSHEALPCRRNARMNPAHLSRHCPLSEKAEQAFRRAAEMLAFSGRAFHGILKMARTIADLEGREIIETDHILEAVQHRRTGDDPYDVIS